ncbi:MULTISPECIES: lytic transglycosylase domain-containing protein [Sphingomonas]|uniref:Transglycosylase SLT domain-containing protein n=2 Tax=Sphingomonadaceae TaxID=41297 RepID=A0A7W7ALV0_9SPHN|nr:MULTISPECIES: lytic transglycosylase domain-containing protein [Sphingomonas]MBB3588694.1 hypothetical protein [Sphingomonas sp. BK481]MBB4619286.1 hypothetical protein [Sphingomonas abaci]
MTSFALGPGLDKGKSLDLHSFKQGVEEVFVQKFYAGVAIASVALATSASAAPEKRGKVRRVELISMTTASALPMAEGDGGPADDLPAPDLPPEFKVHDLSRRYVEFRMKQELASIFPEVSVSDSLAPAVAATSSISVPDWMKPGVGSFTAPAFVPGCAPLAYRPSGFLSREAESRRAIYYGMMSSIACEHGIPTGLFDAMIIRESRYNPTALSPKNAFGFAQLMPGTAMGLGVNRFDPYQNMRGGARYLRQQLDKFGRVQLALAAYNAGPGRVRGGLVPRITETQAYVTDIIANWSRLTAAPGSQALRSTLPQPAYRSVALAQF